MANIRVYELAKNVNKDSKEIIEILKKNGVEVKSHMSSVSDADAQKIIDRFSGKAVVAKTVEQTTVKATNNRQQDEKKDGNGSRPQGEKRDINGNRPQGERRDFNGNRP
ncbi:MAG: translation initiation factor IF-2 N-terminal domain-containing protein, partial [Lachnospiraceae bacterium]